LFSISAGKGEALAIYLPRTPALALVDRKTLEQLPDALIRESLEVFGIRLNFVEV
jgi:hypothetical protein